jgi:tetratricopeptide (TPR) repeat protein
MSLLLAGLWLAAPAHAEETTDLSPALVTVKKPKWDPKGKAIDPFGRGDAKRKKEEWEPAIGLLLQSLDAQPGCGKCLNSLSIALNGADRHADAAQVGEMIVQMFPDRSEGPMRVSTAWLDARELEKSLTATSLYLENDLEKANPAMWLRRNTILLELGKVDEANRILDGASPDPLKEATVACLRIQLLAATDQPAEARELWATCETEEDPDLRRTSEGWLAMAEGDHELAARRLALSGGTDLARLQIAQQRLDEKSYDAALNLTTKLLEQTGWAWDVRLTRAQALHGLGRDDEALAELHAGPTADGWETTHARPTPDHVLLKPRGKEWPRTVAERSLALEIEILVARGEVDKAKALHDRAVTVHGDKPGFAAALATTAPG